MLYCVIIEYLCWRNSWKIKTFKIFKKIKRGFHLYQKIVEIYMNRNYFAVQMNVKAHREYFCYKIHNV